VQIILLECIGYKYVDLDFLTESYANCRVEDYRKADKGSAAVYLSSQAIVVECSGDALKKNVGTVDKHDGVDIQTFHLV
jgi:hypothetical protein